MNKIERPTDKRLKEQIKEYRFNFWVFVIGALISVMLLTFKRSTATRSLIGVGVFISLALFMKVLEILDKIRLEIRAV